ncbi:MAG: GNAT family N-acetyltransferase [Acidimicrobiia bacterium]|nr:GNAT family N-acetyltransferase [Acidimicrobiia bacterium]
MTSIERARISDLGAIRRDLHAFWTGDPPLALHHPMFVLEFGDTALVARDDDGTILGYLFGFLTPASVGYIHLVAVRDGVRGQGIARRLYETFAELPHLHSTRMLKAIANPKNLATIEFHTRLGFSATFDPDYAGTGLERMVFERPLQH